MEYYIIIGIGEYYWNSAHTGTLQIACRNLRRHSNVVATESKRGKKRCPPAEITDSEAKNIIVKLKQLRPPDDSSKILELYDETRLNGIEIN